MLGKGDGLRPLEMGVAGHHGGLVLLRLTAEDRLQLQQLPHDDGDLLPDVHPEVQGHLVIAAAGSVEPLPRVADPGGEQGLHVHVDVLVVGGECRLPRLDVCQNVLQTTGDGGGVLFGDDAAVRQHGGVGHGAGNVLPVQPLVKADGGVEFIHQQVGVFLKASAPEFHKLLFLSWQTQGEEASPPRPCGLVMVLPLPAGHIENIFGRACTCRKYFAPAALGSVHQSEDWWWGGSEGSPLPSEISQSFPCSRSASTVSGRPHRLMKPVALVWS